MIVCTGVPPSPVCKSCLNDLYRKLTEQLRPELFDDSGVHRLPPWIVLHLLQWKTQCLFTYIRSGFVNHYFPVESQKLYLSRPGLVNVQNPTAQQISTSSIKNHDHSVEGDFGECQFCTNCFVFLSFNVIPASACKIFWLCTVVFFTMFIHLNHDFF
jgi:hypothetical protein